MGFNYQTLQIENLKNGIWVLTINRPQALNAINSVVLNELAEFLRTISEMSFDDAKALIVTGSGQKAFVAGADIKEISALDEDQALAFAERGQAIFHEINLLKIPVIAAVNGFALGGGLELALACDFMIAADHAKMGLPEVTLGLIPGFGGTVRLARAIGARQARELTYTGEMVSAEQALQWGLVNRVVPASDLMSTCHAILEKIIQRAPRAVENAKKSINQGWDLDVEAAQKNEARLFSELFSGSDVKEGTSAFLEKRKAQFRGQ